MLPTNKAAAFPGQRIWVGEYGWGNNSFDSQEPLNRAYLQKLLTWGVRFLLYWEIYDNETNADGSYRNFCLIDSNNNKVPCYYLHQRFINRARLAVAQFQETNHRLPNDREFAALLTPTLTQPLPPPINLSVRNSGAKPLTNSAVQVSGTLAQGVYGDDAATVWVFWGRQDGGAVRSAWEGSLNLGLNTNFNPATFSCVLSNLAPNTNYFFRFYATNASGEVWAPASAQMLAPLAFGSRLKITFAGYTRGEPLANFPVLVTLSTNLPGFSYRQFASPLGADLRFTDASGGQLIYHEIDEWNTNGTSYAWVQMPLLATTNDCIWAYWGNPAATTPPAYTTNGSVWAPDSDLVWHLKEASLPFADSARQYPALSGVSPASTAALIGRGSGFNGSSQYLNAGPVNLGSAFTLSAWVKLDATANNIQTVWANKGGGWNANGFALYINSYNTADQKLLLETGNGTSGATAATLANVVPPGQWHRVSAAIDEASGVARLYV
ncbi:MAG TPA: DUF2341 domain-containing protein, partial [Bacillota bacterium]|nr:DUF2341 domain-containing protein [Bacillota bacterium]